MTSGQPANTTDDTSANPDHDANANTNDDTKANPDNDPDTDANDHANDDTKANADDSTGDGVGGTAGGDAECVHQMRAEWCALCKPPQSGVLRRGFRTTVGTVYHNDHRCDWLRRGQWKAKRRGRRLSPVVPVAWADVVPGELAPCEYCCSPDWLRRHRR